MNDEQNQIVRAWEAKQQRQLGEHIARRIDYIARETKRIQRALGVTPNRVTELEVESSELPRGWVKFKRGKQQGMKKLYETE